MMQGYSYSCTWLNAQASSPD